MTPEQTETLRIHRDLQSTKCFCRRRKREGEAFCNRHYCALPQQMRIALYQGFGQGYEQAYGEARKYFEEQKAEV